MSAFEEAVRTVQFLSVDAVEKANCGHPGTPVALAGIGVEIFSQHLRYVPEDPSWPNRDRFVLSCGHASMLLYSLLHLAGYDLSLEDLKEFRQWGSRTPGHPEVGHTAGVETTTGPLGQGVGNAVGMALASKMAGARLNAADSSVIDYRVYALASDGDLMEGVASEAASIAGHLGLGNLIVVYDDNKITIDGSTSLSFSEDVGKRFEAYGWHVSHVDGHDPKAVRAALEAAQAETARPSLIVARTHIAIGAPTKQDTAAAHGAPLGADEVSAMKEKAGWKHPPFTVPAGVREVFAERVKTNRAEREQWQALVSKLPADKNALLDALCARRVPGDVLQELLSVADPKSDATRSHAGRVEQRLAELCPALVGGSADLAESCKTTIKGGGDVSRESFAGRNLHYGIREHAMGAISNGLALSGFFLPFTSTFLVFSDYMRPSIRLAALMGLQVVFVFTHDSVFLGEDGPTHQPVEHVEALRLIPNLDVVRPADALECAAAWAHAATRRDGPTAIILSRQKVPALTRPDSFDNQQLAAGAYVVRAAETPDLSLIATGSEVGVAVGAAEILAKQGYAVRVISAPCLEQWQRQKDPEALFGTARRAALEAGRTRGWLGVLGRDGIAVGVDRFGASAPHTRIAEEFGLTAEKVAARLGKALSPETPEKRA